MDGGRLGRRDGVERSFGLGSGSIGGCVLPRAAGARRRGRPERGAGRAKPRRRAPLEWRRDVARASRRSGRVAGPRGRDASAMGPHGVPRDRFTGCDLARQRARSIAGSASTGPGCVRRGSAACIAGSRPRRARERHHAAGIGRVSGHGSRWPSPCPLSRPCASVSRSRPATAAPCRTVLMMRAGLPREPLPPVHDRARGGGPVPTLSLDRARSITPRAAPPWSTVAPTSRQAPMSRSRGRFAGPAGAFHLPQAHPEHAYGSCRIRSPHAARPPRRPAGAPRLRAGSALRGR
jgi:hypothetical protein